MSNVINSYRFGTVTGGFLLDTYTGAVSAYSLRKLRTGETYACKVRRSSDNATTDIELEETGSISTSSTVSAGGTLGTWIGANGGFIDTWYDQSGNNNDAAQSTAADQPVLIVAGVINTENGEPAIDFDGSNHFLSTFLDTTASANYQSIDDLVSVFIVNKPSVISGSSGVWSPARTVFEIRNNITSGAHVPISYGYDGSNVMYGVTDNYTTSPEKKFGATTLVINTQYLTSSFVNSNNIDIYLDGSSDLSSTFTTATGARNIGGVNDSSNTIGVRTRDGGQPDANFFEGTIQEIIFYDSDESSNRSSIETDINNFYSVF